MEEPMLHMLPVPPESLANLAASFAITLIAGLAGFFAYLVQRHDSNYVIRTIMRPIAGMTSLICLIFLCNTGLIAQNIFVDPVIQVIDEYEKYMEQCECSIDKNFFIARRDNSRGGFNT